MTRGAAAPAPPPARRAICYSHVRGLVRYDDNDRHQCYSTSARGRAPHGRESSRRRCARRCEGRGCARDLRSLSGTACCAAAPPHREIIELAVNMCQDCAPTCPGRTRSVEAASATAAASLGRLRWRDHATILLAASIAATTAGRAMGASAGRALDRQPPWVAIGPSPRFGVDVQPCGQSLCLGDEPSPSRE